MGDSHAASRDIPAHSHIRAASLRDVASLTTDLWLSPTVVLAVRAGGRLSRDLKQIPKDRGRELQRPPRRLLIDVGCPRSYGLKDADRVLVVRAYRIGHPLVRHGRKPGAPPRADLDAATFLPLDVAHERVVDDGTPGIEPVATPPAHRAHPLGHDRTLRRSRSPPKWAHLMLQTHPTLGQRVAMADAWQKRSPRHRLTVNAGVRVRLKPPRSRYASLISRASARKTPSSSGRRLRRRRPARVRLGQIRLGMARGDHHVQLAELAAALEVV